MFALYCISLMIRPNEFASEFFRYYLLYCCTGAFIITYVRDFELMIKTYCWLSLFLFLLCAPLPFVTGDLNYLDMGYFASGMTYGEWVMLPAFVGMYILFKRYHHKWALVSGVICLLIIALYANRGSLLGAVCFVGLYELFIEGKKDTRTYILWILLLAGFIIVYLNLRNILVFVQDQILTPAGMTSRALIKYIRMLSSDEIDATFMTSGRDLINAKALQYIRNYPYFGIGIGTFKVETGDAYTHNIITDAISTFGIFGGGVILVLLMTAIVNVFRTQQKDLKLVLFILLIQCLPRLFLSKTFVNDVPFWMFLTFASMWRKHRIRKESLYLLRNQSTERSLA